MSAADFYKPPSVENKATKPPGILPRHAQTWVLGGVAVTMVLVIGFSSNSQPQRKLIAPSAPAVVDSNEARIQEYRARIDEQQQRLTAEKTRLAQTKAALALTATDGSRVDDVPAIHANARSGTGYAPARPIREPSWTEIEKEKREYQSLFSSNIALSHRTETNGGKTPSSLKQSLPEPEGGTRSDGPILSSQPGESDPPPSKEKTYRLFEGTVIETVLTNRLDGGFSGPLNCMVTTNVYSHDGLKLLIPQGARVLGEVQKIESFGQQRLAVSFHRLIMPDGYSASLDQFQGLNQVGETGLRDKIDHHYVQVFGVSLAIGAIAGLSQANTRYGYDASAGDAYRQGVSASLSQSSLRILERYLNVLPTFTIREGHRVKIYLSNDLLLPAYEKHSQTDL